MKNMNIVLAEVVRKSMNNMYAVVEFESATAVNINAMADDCGNYIDGIEDVINAVINNDKRNWSIVIIARTHTLRIEKMNYKNGDVHVILTSAVSCDDGINVNEDMLNIVYDNSNPLVMETNFELVKFNDVANMIRDFCKFLTK